MEVRSPLGLEKAEDSDLTNKNRLIRNVESFNVDQLHSDKVRHLPHGVVKASFSRGLNYIRYLNANQALGFPSSVKKVTELRRE